MATTAKEIHEAAEAAILDLLTNGKASASFQGRSYTALEVDQLQKISDIYRAKAVQRGELFDPNMSRSICNVLDVSSMQPGE